MDFNIDTVLDVGADEFYRASRYQVPLSVILINSKENMVFDLIEKNLRPTDMIQQLSTDLIVLFLSHTNYDDATSFISNIREDVYFTSTVGEYKGFKDDFVRDLFSQNNRTNL